MAQPNYEMLQQQASEEREVQCYSCLTVFVVSSDCGCTICPTCGQKSCSE
ncbi:hypothetical protein [Paenibacillus koleovorans]|nr:hypothetical protein [Paenibacillus koleovorans]